MVLICHLLTYSVGDHHGAAANGSRSSNICVIVHWPEAVQHFLRTYTTEQATTETLGDFDNIRQNENESEAAYAA